LGVDDLLAIGGNLSMAEIAQACNSKQPELDQESSDDEIDEIEAPESRPVSAKETRDGFKAFQNFVERNFEDPMLLQMCDKFDTVMAEVCIKKMKQMLTDFFTED
jgi:hypothetical protein